jgi:WD40 repeat protein
MLALVVDRDVRPERPDTGEAPQLTDDTWALAERCWVKEPRARPNINTVSNAMGHLLEAHCLLEEEERKTDNKRVGRRDDGADPGGSSPSPFPQRDYSSRWYFLESYDQGEDRDGGLLRLNHLQLRPRSRGGDYEHDRPRHGARVAGQSLRLPSPPIPPPTVPPLKPDHTVSQWPYGSPNLSLPIAGLSTSRNSAVMPERPHIDKPLSAQLTTSLLSGVTFQEACIMKRHTTFFHCVVFSPDGKWIASGSNDHTILVWDSCSGDVFLGPLVGQGAAVWSIAFSHNGCWIASGSVNKSVMVWDTIEGNPLFQPLIGHDDGVRVVVFSPDDTILASGAHDGTILFWDPATGDRRHALTTDGCVKALAFSPDGKHLVSVVTRHSVSIDVWDMTTWQNVRRAETPNTMNMWKFAFSPDSRQLVSTTPDYDICIWDVETGTIVVGPKRGHTDGITDIRFTPDGKWIITGSWDKSIRLWNVKTGGHISQPLKTTGQVWCLAASPDRAQIACGVGNRMLLYRCIDEAKIM